MHFDRLKPCQSDVRLPQPPTTQSSPNQLLITPSAPSPPPIGTNVEIVDDHNPPQRYPQRTSRRAPT